MPTPSSRARFEKTYAPSSPQRVLKVYREQRTCHCMSGSKHAIEIRMLFTHRFRDHSQRLRFLYATQNNISSKSSFTSEISKFSVDSMTCFTALQSRNQSSVVLDEHAIFSHRKVIGGTNTRLITGMLVTYTYIYHCVRLLAGKKCLICRETGRTQASRWIPRVVDSASALRGMFSIRRSTRNTFLFS